MTASGALSRTCSQPPGMSGAEGIAALSASELLPTIAIAFGCERHHLGEKGVNFSPRSRLRQAKGCHALPVSPILERGAGMTASRLPGSARASSGARGRPSSAFYLCTFLGHVLRSLIVAACSMSVMPR
jgi:hypothetical protein